MTIGFALCGSFCTFSRIFPVMEELAGSNKILPILSDAAFSTDTRFGSAGQHILRISEICGTQPIHQITEAEPIGPKQLLDALIVAPCTGNTLAKIAHGIADGPVTMAVKSHLRNGRPVIISVSTNDGLGAAAENIGRLLVRKNIYFVPFRQDDPKNKPNSLVAVEHLIPQTLLHALEGKQIQPVLQ